MCSKKQAALIYLNAYGTIILSTYHWSYLSINVIGWYLKTQMAMKELMLNELCFSSKSGLVTSVTCKNFFQQGMSH